MMCKYSQQLIVHLAPLWLNYVTFSIVLLGCLGLSFWISTAVLSLSLLQLNPILYLV
jgi:hypothetical protein